MVRGKPVECYRTPIPRNYDPQQTLGAYSFHYEYDGTFYHMPSPATLDTLFIKPEPIEIVFYGYRCNIARIQEARFRIGLADRHRFFLRRAQGDPLLACAATHLKGLRPRTTSLWEAAVIAVSQQNRGFRPAWKSIYLFQKMGITTILRRPDGTRAALVYPPTPESIIARLTNGLVSRSYVRTADRHWIEKRLSLLERYFEGKLSPHRAALVEREIKHLSTATGMGTYRVETIARIAALLVDIELRGKSIPRGPRLYSMLINVKGVGPYTAGNIMMLYERDYSYPPVDRWVAKLASRAYGVEEDRDAVARELSRRFGRYAGLAVYYLNIAFDAQPIGKALKRLEKGEICPKKNGVTPLTLWRYNPEDWSLVYRG